MRRRSRYESLPADNIQKESGGKHRLTVREAVCNSDTLLLVDVLSTFLTSSVLPLVAEESRAASEDPGTRAIEIAHALAFGNGLGSSVFAPIHLSVTVEDISVRVPGV